MVTASASNASRSLSRGTEAFPTLRSPVSETNLYLSSAGAELNAEEESIDIEKRRAHRRLVYVGRLSQRKDLQSLLRSTPLLAAANIRLAFWGGSDAQGQKVKNMAHEFGSDHCVETISSRSPEALPLP
jgi:hypothetical protein